MPEGDTIFRAARNLDRALAGRVVRTIETAFPGIARAVDDGLLVGDVIAGATAVGKHLFIAFGQGHRIRTHLRMNGAWHLYRAGERWRRRREDARIVIAVDGLVAVGFRIPDAEVLDAAGWARWNARGTVGPDLLGDDVDVAELARRLLSHGDEAIGVALLRQQVMAGVGNVFKSEVLFVAGIDPFRLVGDLDGAECESIVRHARDLLRANVGPGFGTDPLGSPSKRRTTGLAGPGRSLWVYGREGEPCRRCARPIEVAKQGEDRRLTFWCPACQRATT